MQGFEAVIGLEVHAQLLTESKLFCRCPARFGGEPNDLTCPVCLGLPGVLPVLNEKAVAYAVRFGLAIGCDPTGTSVFARKNYFYPDLPKGYQITQYQQPVVGRGRLEAELEDGTTVTIGITRAHLEEDAGQSVHEGMPQSRTKSHVNLNRAGVPLLEIVSEPDIRSADEAYAYLVALRNLVRYLEICDGNMEEGSMRCDANVSVRPVGQKRFGTRTEIKNLNSFNNVRRGIQHEINRQITLLSQGLEVEQCTLLWDVDSQSTRVMRGKEDSHDYRYFPEPDLPPLVVEPETVAAARRELPELPRQKYLRFRDEYGLSRTDAHLLVSDRDLASYYEEVVRLCGNPKAAANWIQSELLRELKGLDGGIADCPIAAADLAGLIRLIEDRTISGKIGKDVFMDMFRQGASPESIIEARGLRQISDEAALTGVIDEVLAGAEDQIAQYREGKTKVVGFLVGRIMQATRGKANPGLVNKLLLQRLNAPAAG